MSDGLDGSVNTQQSGTLSVASVINVNPALSAIVIMLFILIIGGAAVLITVRKRKKNHPLQK